MRLNIEEEDIIFVLTIVATQNDDLLVVEWSGSRVVPWTELRQIRLEQLPSIVILVGAIL